MALGPNGPSRPANVLLFADLDLPFDSSLRKTSLCDPCC